MDTQKCFFLHIQIIIPNLINIIILLNNLQWNKKQIAGFWLCPSLIILFLPAQGAALASPQCPDPNGVFAYEHPESCNLFFLCTNGTLTVETCENGLLFDGKGNVHHHCNYNWAVDCGTRKADCKYSHQSRADTTVFFFGGRRFNLLEPIKGSQHLITSDKFWISFSFNTEMKKIWFSLLLTTGR